MNPILKLFANLAIGVLSARVAFSQDLLERAKLWSGESKPQIRVSRNDLTLSLSPGLTLPDKSWQSPPVGFGADVSWDFTCGRFDVYANLRHLFSKELADQALSRLIDVAQGELVANGLTTLCTAAPSLCDVFKFHHLSAQALAKLDYDKCARIEQAIMTGQKQGRALAIQACLKEKLDAGIALSQAMRDCERSESKLTDLFGKATARIDLLEELSRVFKLDKDTARDAEVVLGRRKFTAKAVEGETDPAGGEKRYREIKEHYRALWDDAFDRSRQGGKIAEQDLGKLLPYEDLKVIRSELNTLASLPDEDREILKDSLVSRAALAEMAKRLTKLQRVLEAAMTMPGLEQAPARLEEYKRDRDRLGREIERLEREYAQKTATQKRLAEIIKVARARLESTAYKTLVRNDAGLMSQARLKALPRYGEYNPLGSPALPPSGEIPGIRTEQTGSPASGPSSFPCCQTESGFGRTR